MRLSLKDIKNMPTINEGWISDLKIEEDDLRIWVSNVDDSKLRVEILIEGKWKNVTNIVDLVVLKNGNTIHTF